MERAHASVTVSKVDFARRRRNYIICFLTKPFNIDGLHIEYLEPPVSLFSTNELKLQTSVSAPYSRNRRNVKQTFTHRFPSAHQRHRFCSKLSQLPPSLLADENII
jgi:hypothetical protein